jgi:hypothetical protein
LHQINLDDETDVVQVLLVLIDSVSAEDLVCPLYTIPNSEEMLNMPQ